MTNRVSVPGRNISSSQCGIGLNIEKPRIRYRPSSALVWMSSMTSGVKMRLRPRACADSSLDMPSTPLQDELAFVRLQVVVVPQLLAAHELAEGVGTIHPVDLELPVE